jgi:hypothetical protein
MRKGPRRSGRIIGCSVLLFLLTTHEAAGGLYHCRTENGTIYTDTPAQLTQCAPIGPSGGTSPLGLVGGPTTGSAPPSASVPVPPQPQPVSPPTPEASPPPTLTPPAPSGDAATPSPCATGINPLNPLSGPACPTPEAPPSAPITVPPDMSALP